MYFLQCTLFCYTHEPTHTNTLTLFFDIFGGKSPLNIVGLYVAHSIKDIRGPCKCDLL